MKHRTAVIERGAELGREVELGPYAVIGPHVRLGDGVSIGAHTVVTGHTRIGEGTRVSPHVVIGGEPQDRKYDGAVSYVEIGPRCHIREYVSIHRSTHEGSKTILGADCLLMQTSHVAHDCLLGEGVTLGGGSMLAGHIVVDDFAFISGHVVIHQFVRIGRQAMLGGGLRASRDVGPFLLMAQSERIAGVNWVGVRRSDISREGRREIRRLYREIFDTTHTCSERIAHLSATTPEGQTIVDFYQHVSKRGFHRREPETAPSG